MKALVKAYAKPGLWLQEVEEPEVGAGEVKIRVLKTGICGTDLHIYNWDAWAQASVPVPLVVGHEFVGIVQEVGEAVSTVKVGDRVSGEGHLSCGFCRNCRSGRDHLCVRTKGVGINTNGAFAEYICIRESNVYVVPDIVSDDIASILDPLGNAVHTALSQDLVGEDVLITGAGAIGIMAGTICKHVGARHVVISDMNKERLKLATAIGAIGVVPGENYLLEVMRKCNMHEGFDVGLEMSGSEHALNDMLDRKSVV